MPDSPSPILILGAGVHGAAIARELLLNGLPVVLVDRFDIASGATSKSSRLIHGGLRYLEYGDVGLVKESLEERGRNLDLARHFVRPIRLYIPVEHQWSGLVRSGVNFLGLQRTEWGRWLAGPPKSRGFWPTRLGLAMYDWLAQDADFRSSAVTAVGTPQTPRVDPQRYKSLLEYSDAQMPYPERLVFALLDDAANIAAQGQTSFDVRPYATVTWDGDAVVIASPSSLTPLRMKPAAIVNASGAWGDATLQGLDVTALPMFGGTKGSHIVTWHAGLLDALQGQAVYAEADDGRLVFILPFGDAVLIGTTDETFQGHPEDATASDAEIEYLLRMVERVLAVKLTRDDVTMHYSGVRPLPRSTTGANAAISRDHSLAWHHHQSVPVLTLVGGKLTTWRSFAEEVTTHVLGKLGRLRLADTRTRVVPGNDLLPEGASKPNLDLLMRWAEVSRSTVEEVAALWPLYGIRAMVVLMATQDASRRPISDGPWSAATVHWIIEHEHVTRLADLVERRLLCIFRRTITAAMLADLARCLVECGRLAETDVAGEIVHCRERLAKHYGRVVS
ncbi:MAG TPA: glycerol-3-phosphate dehydrogenase/oxidase [Planctomycetaceae bacterium]|nr:glycerol-3-phosphate dehydrogenase/oxidase [Planctomycetaceae bacterium]